MYKYSKKKSSPVVVTGVSNSSIINHQFLNILWNRPENWYGSGQIIATSHNLTPNGGLVKIFSHFEGHLGWLKKWPDGSP